MLEIIAIFGFVYGALMAVSYRYYSKHGAGGIAFRLFAFLEQRAFLWPTICCFFPAALLLTVGSPFCMFSKPLRTVAGIGWFIGSVTLVSVVWMAWK